ncbi:MAG: Bifunctional protein HldE [Elusimicrobia bacterium]|nr:Bifunctional protein HldE [Elusimicrobiota bacterium]
MKPNPKIVDLNELAERVQDFKKKGKKVVLCHGVFDLLHVGHIRHFSEARQMGDVLVVTLTPDEFVNKGPHRPAFTHHLRAEVIAALDAVDLVAVNKGPSAVELLLAVKPNIYAKGPDYKDASKDVTGGIKKEEAAIRQVGGEIRFTEDITFSSSTLVNQHMSLLPPAVKEFLESFRSRFSVSDIQKNIESLKNLKVCVVGETILDDYIYCDAMGKSSKEPILAMRQLSYEMFGGGVIAIANHLSEFCAEVNVVTYLGSKNSYEDFVRSRLKPGVQLHYVTKSESPTIIKRRYVENYSLSKLFEVYLMNDELLEGDEEKELCRLLDAQCGNADVVIVADYGHGMMTPQAIKTVSDKSKYLAVNTQINAANVGFHTISKYPRADYVCIHEGEIRLEHRSRKGDLKTMVEGLGNKVAADKVMVTRGKTGTLFYDRKKKLFSECPALAVKVVDRIGAGDAVLAVTSLLSSKGAEAEMIALLGNLVGAQAVMIVGNRASIDRVQLLKSVESMLK